jgi:hypothetical protein
MTNSNNIPGINEVAITVTLIDGQPWYEAIARNEVSGLCETADAAIVRLAQWFAGDEISEAPNGQASVLQMQALADNMPTFRDGGAAARTVKDALDFGLNTDQWILATKLVVKMYRSIPAVATAGGRKISRQ